MKNMDCVPQIISTKDLSYLSDMFEWNSNAFKQVNHFINEVKDEEVKELLERIRNMHEDHLNFIVSMLKQEEYEEYDFDECECEECDCMEMEEDDDEE